MLCNKNIFRAFAFIALTAMSLFFASCDKNADKISIDAVDGDYIGVASLNLCAIELKMDDIGTCDIIDTVWVHTKFIENASMVEISIDKPFDVMCNIPFLDEEGNVLEIYQEGAIAKLYEYLKYADSKGVLEPGIFDAVKSNFENIRDTITIPALKFDPIPLYDSGALLTTFDYEKYSPYSRFTMLPAEFSRKGTVFNALKILEPLLYKYYEAGLLPEELVKELTQISEQKTAVINDGKGDCIFGYSNYAFDLVFRMTSAANWLNNISIALFGKNEKENKPNVTVWALLQFGGVISKIYDYQQTAG